MAVTLQDSLRPLDDVDTSFLAYEIAHKRLTRLGLQRTLVSKVNEILKSVDRHLKAPYWKD